MSNLGHQLDNGLTPAQLKAVDFAYYSFTRIAELTNLSAKTTPPFLTELSATSLTTIAIGSLEGLVNTLPFFSASLNSSTPVPDLERNCREICELQIKLAQRSEAEPTSSPDAVIVGISRAHSDFGELCQAYLSGDKRSARQSLATLAESVGLVMLQLNDGLAARFDAEGSPSIHVLLDQQHGRNCGTVRLHIHDEMVSIQTNLGRMGIKACNAGGAFLVVQDTEQDAAPRPALLGDIAAMINLAGKVSGAAFSNFDLAVHTKSSLLESGNGRSLRPLERIQILEELTDIYHEQENSLPTLPLSRPAQLRIALSDTKLAIYHLPQGEADTPQASKLQIFTLDNDGTLIHRGPNWDELKAFARVLSRYDGLELSCCDLALKNG